MCPAKRLSVSFVGLPQDDRDVRLAAFLKKLEAVKETLIETDKAVSDGERTADFKVVDLRHESPATMDIEEIALDEEDLELPNHIIDTYYETLSALQGRGEVTANFDYDALQKFKALEPSTKGVTEMVFSLNGEVVSLTAGLSDNIEFILGEDEYEVGSVTGMLQHINVHGKQKIFTIYPVAGEPKLKCRFSDNLREEVVEAVDCYVEVSGMMTYKAGNLYPYEMRAEHIEVYPDESELPSPGQLFGIAPNATGGKSSEEFVRDLRRGW